jgi:hypothetical protein
MSPPRRTELARSTRPRGRGSRSALILLVVAAALLAPIRAADADARLTTDDVHHLARTGLTNPTPHHLAVAHTLRGLGHAHWRTGTPLGTVPATVILAIALLTLVAVARLGTITVHRPRPAFARRGPPVLPATG